MFMQNFVEIGLQLPAYLKKGQRALFLLDTKKFNYCFDVL